MRTRQTMTISLPPEMMEEVEVLRSMEHRTRSELMREALRQYFSTRFPVEKPTAAEVRGIRAGRAAVKRGDYVTLEQLKNELGTGGRRTRKKRA